MNFLIAVKSATNPRRLCHGMAFALAHYVGPVTMPIALPKGFHHSMVHNDRGWSVWRGGWDYNPNLDGGLLQDGTTASTVIWGCG